MNSIRFALIAAASLISIASHAADSNESKLALLVAIQGSASKAECVGGTFQASGSNGVVCLRPVDKKTCVAGWFQASGVQEATCLPSADAPPSSTAAQLKTTEIR